MQKDADTAPHDAVFHVLHDAVCFVKLSFEVMGFLTVSLKLCNTTLCCTIRIKPSFADAVGMYTPKHGPDQYHKHNAKTCQS